MGWKVFQVAVIGLFGLIGLWGSIEQGEPGFLFGMVLFGILIAGGLTYGISDFQDWRLGRAARRNGGEQHANEHLRTGLEVRERSHPVNSTLPPQQDFRQLPRRPL